MSERISPYAVASRKLRSGGELSPGDEASLAHRLQHMGHKIRAYQREFSILSTDDKLREVTGSIRRIIGPDAGETVVNKIFGEPNPTFEEEEFEDLSPSARARIQQMFEHKMEPLWVWTLMDDKSPHHERVARSYGAQVETSWLHDRAGYLDEFMTIYDALALSTGLFPHDPHLENVGRQRVIAYPERFLGLSVKFIQNMELLRNQQAVGGMVLQHIAQAMEEYGQHPVDEIRAAVAEKVGNDPVILERLQAEDMWQDPERLAAMCVSRELREFVIYYYGIFRGIRQAPISGYNLGQKQMAMNIVMRQMMRVAHAEEHEERKGQV